MGVPKRRTSKTRKNSRRATYKLAGQTIVACPHCHEPKMSHRVCPSCGYYDERKVIEK
jgi:large subunit ribosomal protein L32